MRKLRASVVALATALSLGAFQKTAVEATSFSNPNPISIPSSGTEGIANPYASTINVSGLSGTITDVNITINGLYHTFPDDLDMLLVSPNGQKVIFMSDAGGPHDVNNFTITFDDEALSFPSNGNSLTAGLFKPVNYTGNGGPDDIFPVPAPAGPYGTLLSAFDGTNPNGTWSLFVFDDQGSDVGRIANGWSLEIATAVPEPATWILVGAGLIAIVRRRKQA